MCVLVTLSVSVMVLTLWLTRVNVSVVVSARRLVPRVLCIKWNVYEKEEKME